VKYGALSVPEGRVTLSWTAEDGRLNLVWQERGGPPVSPPARRGFGTRMIERGLAAELAGTAQIDFRANGVVCTLEAPLPQGSAGDSSGRESASS
jgi:two-component sensor histidine kinase